MRESFINRYVIFIFMAAFIFSLILPEPGPELAPKPLGPTNPSDYENLNEPYPSVIRYKGLSDEQKMFLAKNMFFESRSSIVGMVAISQTVWHRVKSDKFPNDAVGVIYQNKQFSWTDDGLPDHPSYYFDNYMERHAWQRSKLVADALTKGNFKDIIKGSKYYHADYVSPSWSNDMEKVAYVNNHWFFKE